MWLGLVAGLASAAVLLLAAWQVAVRIKDVSFIDAIWGGGMAVLALGGLCGAVAVAWMGYSEPRSLGERESGGGLALPIWIDYMASALKGVPIASAARSTTSGMSRIWRATPLASRPCLSRS